MSGNLAKALVAVFVLSFVNNADAFWRMECRGQLAIARMDPLMDPGVASGHVHTIQGSSGFSESATYEDLRNGNCTSCAVPEDKSAYWTPALYFQHSNGSFEIVSQVGGMLAYYLPRGDNVTGFPAGFRMLAGDAMRRNYTVGDVYKPDPGQSEWAALNQTNQNDLAQRAIGFNCLNYDKAAEAALYRHFMPSKDYLDANCLDGLRLELAFPSCWNGKDLDSADHSSHVQYPDLVQDGDCLDPDYQHRLVTLFYETIWDTAAFTGVDGQFVLANGDPTGFGYHGDFLMGWDEAFLQNAVDTCTNESGEIEDCALFEIDDEVTQGECTIDLPASLAKENVLGTSEPLNQLPSCIQIQAGPEPATIATCGGSATAVTASTPTSTYVAPTLGYQSETISSYPGGGIFLETSSAVSSAESTPIAVEAVTTPSPTTTPVSYTAVSTEYHTSAVGQVQEVVWEEAVVYVTEDIVETVTVTPTGTPTGGAAKRHLWQHRHHAHR